MTKSCRGAGLALAALLAALPAQASGAQHGEPETELTTDAKEEALAEAFAVAGLWVESLRTYRKIPAISAAVVAGDRTVWARGFGTTDRAGRKAASPDTIYSICSISKLFTAVALMQQWEAGKVTLDAPITEYLPWARFADDSRESVPITLRGALTHSAGLPRESDYPYWTWPDFRFPSQAEVRTRIASQAPLYPAETHFQYSNLGLTLVGETVEAVSGIPYREYVRAHIIAPLGLTDTRPTIPGDLYGEQMAVGWGALRPDGTRPEVKLFDAAGITPAAGFSSTVADLAKFAGWTFRLAKTGEPEVLQASTLREMERVHYISPDWNTSWGLGFSVRNQEGTTVVGHGGSCPGYRSTLMMAPTEEMAVAVAMNAMDNPEDVALGIASLVKARGKADVFPAVEGVDLNDFVGVYDAQPWTAEFLTLRWAGGLIQLDRDSEKPGERMSRLKPIGGDRFQVVTETGENRHIVTFERDVSGRVVTLHEHSNSYRRIRPL